MGTSSWLEEPNDPVVAGCQSGWQADLRRFGHYEVLSKIGEGGMGQVFRVRDRRDQIEAVLKVLRPDLQGDLDHRAMFLREALLAADIEHENVARLLDYGEVHLDNNERTLYLAIEFVPGRDLAQRRSFEDFSQRRVLSLMKQVASGLTAVHHRLIVHRDLKPANLLVSVSESGDDLVKIIDFGLAEKLAPIGTGAQLELKLPRPADVRGNERLVGTAGYAAPEQMRGDPVSPRSDLFALGVVAYQLLGDRLPYPGDRPAEIYARMRAGDPQSLGDLRPGMAPGLEVLIRDLLSYSERERPASAEEVLSRIEDIEETESERLDHEAAEDEEEDAGSGEPERASWWRRILD